MGAILARLRARNFCYGYAGLTADHKINEAAVGKVVNTGKITTHDVPTTPDGEEDDFEFPITPNSGGSEDPEPDESDKTPDKVPVSQKNAPTNGTMATSANTIPRTGDTASPTLWLMLLALSGISLASAYRLRRREER